MPRDKDTTLAHLYGLPGVVLGIVGVVALFNANKPWIDQLVWGSGWAMAILMAIFLWRSSVRARDDGVAIGSLETEVDHLKTQLTGELARRKVHIDELNGQIKQLTSTLGYLSTQLTSGPAIPRRIITEEGSTDV